MLGLGIAKKIGLGKIAQRLIIIKKNRALKKELILNRIKVKERKKQKIFVIGFNKTGTTSIEKGLSEFDFIMGHQRTAENLLESIIKKDYKPLIEYCKTAEAFQDFPFSFPEIYQILDKTYPNSKFILTIRDSSDQWFNSITKFHSKLWGKDGNIPTERDLINATYVKEGYLLKSIHHLFGKKLYDKKTYTSIYEKHNNEVIQYFKDRPKDFIVINVSNKSDYKNLCHFINVVPIRDTFSWENKTDSIS